MDIFDYKLLVFSTRSLFTLFCVLLLLNSLIEHYFLDLQVVFLLSFWYHFVQGFLPVPDLIPLNQNVEHVVHRQHCGRLQLHVIGDWQPRVLDSLCVGFVQRKILVPVSVNYATDYVGFALV